MSINHMGQLLDGFAGKYDLVYQTCLFFRIVMVVSKYGFKDIPDYDASRIAARIVSGIGLLGAGVIVVKNNSVSGLTTAAGIRATASVGMAIGAGSCYVGFGTGLF